MRLFENFLQSQREKHLRFLKEWKDKENPFAACCPCANTPEQKNCALPPTPEAGLDLLDLLQA